MDQMHSNASYSAARMNNGNERNEITALKENLAAMSEKALEAANLLIAAKDVSGWSASDPMQGLQRVVNAAILLALVKHRLQQLILWYGGTDRGVQQDLIEEHLERVTNMYTDHGHWVFASQLAIEPIWTI